MKKIILTSCLLLMACGGGTAPGVEPVSIPPLPSNLNQKAGKLPPIQDNTMGGMVREGIVSDRAYNDVSTRLNAVIDIYNCVRATVNDAKQLNDCFKK